MRSVQRQRTQQRNNNSNKVGKAPSVTGSNDGIRVKHTEFLSGLNRKMAGYIIDGVRKESRVIRFGLNPGDGQTFPWLSQVAPNYEYYTINRIKFTYEPTVSQFISGAFCISPEFDPRDDSTITNETLATYLNRRYAVKTQVAKAVSTQFDLGYKGKMYVRATHKASHDHASLRHYDAGHVDCFLYNVLSTDPEDYGEIKVEYDISLSTPNLSFSNAKSHHSKVANVTTGTVAVHGCPFDSEITNSTVPTYHGDGTLGVTTSYRGTTSGITALATGDACRSNRLHFEEPFQGTLTLHTDTMGGGIATPPKLFLDDEIVIPGTLPRAEWDLVKAAGDIANGVLVVYNVIAKAGDVMDMVWDTLGVADVTGYTEMILTDMASNVLPLLIA